MNTVILLGRLTRDPEVRYSKGENPKAICNLNIAVRKSYTREGEPDANFIDCVAFGGTAEFIEKYFGKGQPIAVRGELNIEQWEDKDGNSRRSARIHIDKVDFAGGSNQESDDKSTRSSRGSSSYKDRRR